MKIEKGDIIKYQGIKAVVKKIISQYEDHDYNPETGVLIHEHYGIEFLDENDVYRYWKSRFDGGRLIRKDGSEEEK